LLSKIEHIPPTPLRQIDRQIHPDLAAVITRALAKDPADRYATPAELRDELRRFMEGRPVKTRPVPAYARFWRWCKRNPWLAAANIAAAAVTTILAIGSTIAAKVYYDKSEQIADDARRLELSEIDGRRKLFDAQVERARAGRFSRRVGQRFDSLDALDKAAKLGRGLGLPAERFDRLRDEAIACMALPDMKPAGPPIRTPEGMIKFAFDTGMTRYAVRLLDGTILVRRMGDDQEIARFTAHGDRGIWIHALSPDGRYLATEDWPSRAVAVWDINRAALCLRDPGPVSDFAAGFSPASNRIAMAHDDGSLLVYDLISGQCSRRWRGPDSAHDLAFRPDAREIAVVHGGNQPTCRILDSDTGQHLRTFSLPSAGTVAWSPDGTTLAIPNAEAKISLWDAATGRRKAILEGATNSGLWTSFHPSGTLLASSGYEFRLRLWDSVLGRQILSLTSGGGELYPAFSQDGRIVAGLGN
jgi:eukaryotic-like serine/threonine-protein kinase